MASVGPTLKVEGFAQYKKNMNELIQQGKTLDSEMKKVASTWDENTTAQQKAADKAKVLTEKVENQRKQVDALKDMVEKATAQYGESSKEAQTYKEKLNLAEAALNDMNRELDKSQAELKQSAEKTEDAAEKTEDAGKESKKAGKKIEAMGKAGEAAGKLLKGMGGMAKAAAATATAAFAATVAAASKVVSALTSMTVEGSEYADQILTESAVTGLSTDSLQKYHYAAELVDVDVGTITNSLAKNTKQMASAQKGTGSAADAYAKLGVKVTKSNGELRNSEKVFWEAIDALGKIENETERDALAMELFGKSAQELNPLIKAGSDRMKELGEQAEAAGAVMSDDMINAYGEFNDKLQELESGVDVAKRALGTALLPILDELAGAGVDLLSDFSQALLDCNGDIEQMASVAGEYLGKAVQMITDYVPEMVTMGGELVGGLLSGIAQNLPEIVSSVTAALDDLTGKISGFLHNPEQLQKIITAGVDLLISLVTNISEIATAVVDALPFIIDSIVEALTAEDGENIRKIIQAGVTLLTALITNLPEIITTIVDALPQIIEDIFTELTKPDNLTKMGEAGVDLMTALFEAVKKIFKQLVEWIGKGIENLAAAIGIKVKLTSDGNSVGFSASSSSTDPLKDFAKSYVEEKGLMPSDNSAGFTPYTSASGHRVTSQTSGIKKQKAGSGHTALRAAGRAVRDAYRMAGQQGEVGSDGTIYIGAHAEGGILKRGQIALLEGEGAEAVVPLEKHTEWIAAVGRELAGYLAGTAPVPLDSGRGSGGTTNNYTRNLGGVTIEIHAAPGQSEEAIADAVMDRINDLMTGERDAW